MLSRALPDVWLRLLDLKEGSKYDDGDDGDDGGSGDAPVWLHLVELR